MSRAESRLEAEGESFGAGRRVVWELSGATRVQGGENSF